MKVRSWRPGGGGDRGREGDSDRGNRHGILIGTGRLCGFVVQRGGCERWRWRADSNAVELTNWWKIRGAWRGVAWGEGGWGEEETTSATMSWFSRSFSMTEEEERRREEEEDEDEEEEDGTGLLNLAEIASATGASIKEDFSNLTKTFTRQLWGVASFIAPSPPEKSLTAAERGEDEEEKSQEQQGTDEEVRGASFAAASAREFYIGQVEGFSSENFAGGGTTSGGAFLAPVESNPQLILSHRDSNNGVSNVVLSGDGNSLSGSRRGFEQPKLTGLRSDFAELRGTVATGISRITSVLREVAGDGDSGEDDEDEEHDHLPFVSSHESPHHPLSSGVVGEQQPGVNSPRLSFDAFLKPLFGNMLIREKSSIEGDVYPAEDEAAGRGSYYSRESPKGTGEPMHRDLESLPSAIASGIGGISKFASSLLQIVTDELDEDEEDQLEDDDLALGLTEPVVTFAKNIAMHPETWLDFPLAEDDVDDDFELTKAQTDHIRSLEIAAPALKALKIELCPKYMTEGRFWKIYFVLMYSRLSSNEALMLSNQQVVQARASMLEELQRRELHTDELHASQEDVINEKVVFDADEASQQDMEQAEDGFGSRLSTPSANNTAVSNSAVFPEDGSQAGKASKLDKSVSTGSTVSTELMQSEQDKGRFSMLHLTDETEVDEWPDEEPSLKQDEIDDPDSRLDTRNLDDEDVSFSDLEEDDSSDKATPINEGTTLSSPKNPISGVLDIAQAIPSVPRETSSPMTQGDGTPRKSSERGEFNDWFKVDQDDVASAGSSSP